MTFRHLPITLTPLPGAVPCWQAECNIESLRSLLEAAHAQGSRLGALWGADQRPEGRGFALQLALANPGGLLWLRVPLPENRPEYPDIAGIFACAQRMQRAAFDFTGIRAVGADERPWLRHAAWPRDVHPLRRDFSPTRRFAPSTEQYAFVSVEGEGVHEVPVGPVHAGTIEPGHFRFSVVGEKVLRLEERLGYAHKGIEKRFESLSLAEGGRLAGRISGDSTVAYAWAYAMALESMANMTPPARASWLRALLLERERVANHLGDLGSLGNDGGLAFGLAQFMRLKEDWLRTNARMAGHRYFMDCIVPGGLAQDIAPEVLAECAAQCDSIEREVNLLKDIYDDHAGLQDRFLTCGRLVPETASRLGVIGLAGRASAQAWDMRAQPGLPPYDALGPRMVTRAQGDVAARVAVRFEEIFEALRLIRAICAQAAPGKVHEPLPEVSAGATGMGWIEAWRGEVLVALEAGPGGRIRRCHAHDPSWQNWPAVGHAAIGNIVPDFPLINKSFNLSYSGHDL